VTAPDSPHLVSRVSTASVAVRWLVLDDVLPDQWEQLALLLEDSERTRAQRFHFDRDRQAYFAAHALVRAMLSGQVPRLLPDWRFSANVHGKPEVICEAGLPPLRFNLSHTRGLVAVALTLEHDIGIDVELVDSKRFSFDLAARTFAPEEVDILRATSAPDQPRALFAIWTLKEACIKAMGRGLSMPLAEFALSLDPLAVRFAERHGEDSARWVLRRFAPTPTHVMAVALRLSAPAAISIEAARVMPADLLAFAAAQVPPGEGEI
jgi:4'-phosphopantetheinyl transferase